MGLTYDNMKGMEKQMVRGGSVLNLSGLIWLDEAGPAEAGRSVFLVQDFQNEDFAPGSYKYFLITLGDDIIEDSMGSYSYLAVLKRDGRYTMERMEGYMEKRDVKWRKDVMVLDLLKLPDEINGVRLHKAADFQRTALNRWRTGIFRSEGGDETAWVPELERTASGKEAEKPIQEVCVGEDR